MHVQFVKRFTISLLVCLLCAYTVFAQKKVKVFILSGQSNMGGGRPRENAATPAEGEIWYDYASPENPESRTENWVSMNNLIGVGVESTFGPAIKKAFPDEQVALMKCNKSATPIGYWIPGGNGNEELELRIQTVKERLDAQVAAGEISAYEWAGFVWFQGENDAAKGASTGNSAQYVDRLNRLIAWVREKTATVALPVVIIRIYDYAAGSKMQGTPPYFGPWGNLEMVRTAHVKFAQADQHADWVDTDDLPIKPGEPHYFKEAYEEAGRRSAQAYINIVQGAIKPQSPFVSTIPVNGGVLLAWKYVQMATTNCTYLRRGYTYTIEYGTSPDNLEHRVNGIDENQHVIRGLHNDTPYWFRVTSVDGNTIGNSSMVVSDTPAVNSVADSFHIGFPRFVDASVGKLQLDATNISAYEPSEITWQKISGPGSVAFSDPNSLDPIATFGLSGPYLLRCRIRVSGTTYTDSLHVWVRPAVSQSSAHGGRWAKFAVDNDAGMDAHSFHTQNDNEAWWEMDLGAVAEMIDSVRLHNRISCASRLKDFYVFVSDDPFVSKSVAETREQPGVWEYFHKDTLTGPSLSIPVEHSGRFVRVQLSGRNYLHLREVTAVIGNDGTTRVEQMKNQPAITNFSLQQYGSNSFRIVGNNIGSLSVRVLDLQGRTVFHRKFDGSNGIIQIALPPHAKSMHIVRIKSGKVTKNISIIKMF